MIFVTVGANPHQFDRLVKAADELAIKEKSIFIQIGNSKYSPKNAKFKRFMKDVEHKRFMKKAKLIITHAGSGNVITGLQFNKLMIIVPRRKKYGEHVDDHQLELANYLKNRKNCYVVHDVNNLEKHIQKIKVKKQIFKKDRKPKILGIIRNFVKQEVMQMKILGIGNLNRMGEIYCQIFRDLGHQADLLIWHPTDKPTTSIKPIKTSGMIKEITLFGKLLELRNKYDMFICHFAFQSAVFSNWLGLKYISHVRGHDITHNPKHWLYGSFVKSAFKNSKAIWCSTPVLVKHAKKYNKKVHFIPNIIKTDVYKPMKLRKKNRFMIFMPIRHTWSKKGNDIAINLFNKISKKIDAELHFIEYGEDVERSKKLIENLELKNVVWHPHTFDEKWMSKMYNMTDVVWDSFGDTSDRLNLVALEAMSCSAPLIIRKLKKGLYPEEPPVIQVNDLDDIIEKSINIQKHRANLKKQRIWVEKYCSYEKVKEQVKRLLEEVKE